MNYLRHGYDFLNQAVLQKKSRNWLSKNFAFISQRVDLIGFDTVKQNRVEWEADIYGN